MFSNKAWERTILLFHVFESTLGSTSTYWPLSPHDKCLFCFCLNDSQDGFSKNPFFHGIIAEVPEQHRTKEGKGVGKALMSKVAQLALAAGCHQLNFTILNWNKPSMDFYLGQGCFDATATIGYHCMRCEGEALKQLAQL
uniref:Spermidine/spermine N1-acetyltransferase family member 2 n=1 Tax=Pundamilia nyererei TaxID=303518 RepID=A0A3B4FY98_9CICH